MASVTDFYGRWATLYDLIATAPGVGRWRRAAAERVARPGDTVVEMGCGTGANLPYLRERVGPAGRVLGVDLTGPLLARGRRRAAAYDNVSVVRGDATEPPVRSADGVLGMFVCGMFEEPGPVVARWCDLAGSGSRVALVDATATEATLGRPLNPLFRMFVAASAPGTGIADTARAPLEVADEPLAERVSAARTALVDRTDDRSYETFGLGFVGLLAGCVR